MKPTLMSIVIAGLLSAACMTTLADPPRKHHGTMSTTSESGSALPSTDSASAIPQDEVADTDDESAEATTKISTDSSQTTTPAAPEIPKGVEAEASRKPSY